MELTTVWFIVIAFLWTSYFFLEGFDFGVGMLLPVLGRSNVERRVVINTIGPVWDANEVWFIVAGASIFAAFPEWYATLFSGFYLPLLAILLALIIRGVAFEYRGKRDDARWRSRWDKAIFWGSLVPAFLWGVVFANIVRGVPLDADHEFAGTLGDLLTPYALLGGLTTMILFVLHGAVFLALKTTGDIRARARFVAGVAAIGAIAAGGSFLLITQVKHGEPVTWLTAAGAAAGLVLAAGAIRRGREGWAFIGTGAAIVLAVATLFVALFPDVLPSTLAEANSLTTDNASSTPYTLKIMTWTAAVFTPIVLVYQGWTYWVFRKRIGTAQIPRPKNEPVR
ncbi:cytochrome bd-I ubiquinol oxidase subunit 2 apoprotein [Actinomadura pelletieri DSM 43383]|uniref:Cytochrome bd-I ubiquinol oxidase subunit 2 apoprotein n=1 Tax=Actinomadura pelletieri DSM 43383 TaxID=1120940 RepID=A0A495QYI9_9ACTN|nr:cytochrome d ubiquinol oxidase subunit II [Actinomadura pelletieri]RKS79261.1 cytochrome bd-I ubiquinol oxidase subunit 2 apoprotein [Actinomadura pelletieri DSM 43383]